MGIFSVSCAIRGITSSSSIRGGAEYSTIRRGASSSSICKKVNRNSIRIDASHIKILLSQKLTSNCERHFTRHIFVFFARSVVAERAFSSSIHPPQKEENTFLRHALFLRFLWEKLLSSFLSNMFGMLM